MQTIKTKLKMLAAMTAILTAPMTLRAEATKEYTRDAGLYNKAGEPFQICVFPSAGVFVPVLDFFDTSQLDRPEGLTSVKTVTSGGSGAWGYYNTNTYGVCNFDVAPRNFTEYAGGHVRFWLKSNAVVQVKIEAGPGGGSTTALSIGNTGGIWREIVIPLQGGPGTFALNATQLQNVRAPMIFEATTNTTFYVDHFRWTKPVAAVTIFPSSATVQTGKRRQFTIEGRDSSINGGERVIIYSTFPASVTPGAFSPAGGLILQSGSITSSTGVITASTLTATGASGNATVNFASLSTSAFVNITAFGNNEQLGIYSETVFPRLSIGVDSDIGVSTGNVLANPVLLDEPSASAIEGGRQFKASLGIQPGTDSFAGYYFQWSLNPSDTVTRDMNQYYEGALKFFVKAPAALQNNLQLVVRSGNVDAGTELSKVFLKDRGVVFNDTWQSVSIPIRELTGARPWADISRMKILFGMFAIGVVNTAETFYVDNVRWVTDLSAVPSDESKIYIGLKQKQQSGGLVRSFENFNRAVTYDQALAAMNFTYQKDVPLTRKIFDVYKNIRTNYGGAFNGFHNEYNVSSSSTAFVILDGNRTAGPNAFLLLSLIHYRNVSADVAYDNLIDDTAAWLRSLQQADGAVQFGVTAGGAAMLEKSTEQNIDCYAAFKAYAQLRANNSYNVWASSIAVWLNTQMYVPAQQRFKTGIKTNSNHNWDRALDNYSLPYLAFSSFTNVLTIAETDPVNTFVATKVSDLTNVPVTGFDFSGPALLEETPPGAAPDRDAVWLEGTAQMALSFYLSGNTAKGDFYMSEIDKSVVNLPPAGQGMAYATNNGTGYGFNMDSLNPAVSSMAWYLFAKKRFNPMRPYPLHSVRIIDTATSVETSSFTWNVTVPAQWVRANQMIRIEDQSISTDNWGIQIYTDNTNPASTPRFQAPSAIPLNPAGLLRALPGDSTTYYKLNMAWSVKDTTAPAQIPAAADPGAGLPASAQWIFMKDRATPNIPSQNITAFVDGQPAVVVRQSASGVGFSHTTQPDSGFVSTPSPDYLFLETDFNTAAAQVNYKANILLEFFLQ